jgi:L-proline amide hydrolase
MQRHQSTLTHCAHCYQWENEETHFCHGISPLGQMALSGRPIIHSDQIGCGYSSVLSDEQVSQLTVEFFLDELQNLINHLGIADDYLILGHSWGGMMAQEFALRQPTGLRGLILSSSLASASAWGAEVHRLAALLPDGFGEKYQAMMAGEELSDEECPDPRKSVHLL